MTFNRRELLIGSATAVVPAVVSANRAHRRPQIPGSATADRPRPGAAARADFPRASQVTYLNSAGQHPLGNFARQAIDRHLDYQQFGPTTDQHESGTRAYFSRDDQIALKTEFGELINASADEIAFVQSTSDGENIVVAGLGLPRAGGNVVVDDLHFTSSLYLYKMLEGQGVELRVVRQKNGAVSAHAMAEAIDEKTRLVSMALVSNINGFQHDVRAVADVAHRHGALLYADIIQAVGAVPLDMLALGIDCAAASTYKWLMAERGFGLLYVRKDLQESRLPTTRWGHRHVTSFDRRGEFSWKPRPGSSIYETGNISEPLAAMTLGAIRYIRAMGVDTIVGHAQELVGELRTALERRGYPCLTPQGTKTPIVAFHLEEPDAVLQRLRDAGIVATVDRADRRLRLSVSVFNTEHDVERVVAALA